MKKILWLKIFGTAAVLLAAALVVFMLAQPVPEPAPRLQGVNGYTNLLRAALSLEGDLEDLKTADIALLQAYVRTNRAFLDLAREGLQQPCQVDLEYQEYYLNRHLPQIAALKRLVQAMIAEGWLAELENRRSDAARIYLDALILSREICRGGVTIDKLVGIAGDAIACQHLSRLAGRLDAAEAKTAVKALEAFQEREEPVEAVIRQEKAYCHRAFGLRERLVAIFTYKQRQAMEENLRAKYEARIRQRRQLTVDLAARAYELENSRAPKSLSDLTPAYLKQTPPGASLSRVKSL